MRAVDGAFHAILRKCHRDGVAGFSVDARDCRDSLDVDAVLFENVAESLSDVVVFAEQRPIGALDDRHSASEPPHGLRQLRANVTGAENDKVLGHSVEFERFDMRERLGFQRGRESGRSWRACRC